MKANRVQAAEYQTIFIVYSIRTKKKLKKKNIANITMQI